MFPPELNKPPFTGEGNTPNTVESRKRIILMYLLSLLESPTTSIDIFILELPSIVVIDCDQICVPLLTVGVEVISSLVEPDLGEMLPEIICRILLAMLLF